MSKQTNKQPAPAATPNKSPPKAARQTAAYLIRKKNRAAQSNPVTGADGDTINARVPLQ